MEKEQKGYIQVCGIDTIRVSIPTDRMIAALGLIDGCEEYGLITVDLLVGRMKLATVEIFPLMN